jgi:predicted nuclease of predicted toxin-antitoxin system
MSRSSRWLVDARTIVSADTDFGALLAATGATAPAVILVREVVDRRPPDLVELRVGCIEQLEPRMHSGAMVALTSSVARLRRLPLP